jgi:hypothetical protein
LVDHTLELIDVTVCLIQDDVVVNRASRALDGSVRAEVEVILKSWEKSVIVKEIKPESWKLTDE